MNIIEKKVQEGLLKNGYKANGNGNITQQDFFNLQDSIFGDLDEKDFTDKEVLGALLVVAVENSAAIRSRGENNKDYYQGEVFFKYVGLLIEKAFTNVK